MQRGAAQPPQAQNCVSAYLHQPPRLNRRAARNRVLLTGRLLPPAQQRELLATIPVDDPGELFAEHYGLGIYRVQLPCGTAWGHDGGYPGGFKTFAYASPDGSRQAVMIYNDFKMSIPPPAGTGTPAGQNLSRTRLKRRMGCPGVWWKWMRRRR